MHAQVSLLFAWYPTHMFSPKRPLSRPPRTHRPWPRTGHAFRYSEPVWANYVKGVLAQMPDSAPGFDAAIATSVPIGGGLSSSASLEVCVHTFVDVLMTGKSDNTKEKALRCQKAEHTYAGMPCGIMDQYIATFGEKGHALLIDCRSLDARPVPIADPNVVVFIANSNVTHKLSDSECVDSLPSRYHLHSHSHVRKHAHACTHTHTHTYTHTHVHAQAYAITCTRTCTRRTRSAHTHTHTHMHMHTCTQAHSV
jgi:mevalonate kinase